MVAHDINQVGTTFRVKGVDAPNKGYFVPLFFENVSEHDGPKAGDGTLLRWWPSSRRDGGLLESARGHSPPYFAVCSVDRAIRAGKLMCVGTRSCA